MKNIAIFLTLYALFIGSVLHATNKQEDDYTNQIIQIQYDELGNEIRYPVVVGTTGQMAAPMEILYGESIFELWSVRNDKPSEPVLLDTTEVNGYFSPEIWIDTPDPSDTFSAPRTRVDVPYSVRIEGVADAYVDNAAGSLQLVVNVENLPGNSPDFPHNHETNYEQGYPINSLLYDMLSGSVKAVSSYVDKEWTEVWGRETFSVWDKDAVGTSMLSSRHVNIWPTATINFEPGKELTDGATYRVFPEIEVRIENLYAVDNWRVWVQSQDGTEFPLNSGSVTGILPQDRQVPLTDLLVEKIKKTGTYTLYASQQAPGLDAMPNIKEMGSFTYIERIKVRANVVGSE